MDDDKKLEFDDVPDQLDGPENKAIEEDISEGDARRIAKIEALKKDPYIIKWKKADYNFKHLFPFKASLWVELEHKGVFPSYLARVATGNAVPSFTIAFCYVVMRRAGVPVKQKELADMPLALVNDIMTKILLASSLHSEEETDAEPDYPFSV